MATLTILTKNGVVEVPFDASRLPLIDEVLASVGLSVPHPCGGRGLCGKCAVTVVGSVSTPDDIEEKLGKRLSCRTRLTGDATVDLRDNASNLVIEASDDDIPGDARCQSGELGIACDIGTTTVVVGLYELQSGRQLAVASEENPQTCVAADVIGRISAALDGQSARLCDLIRSSIERLTERCLHTAGQSRSSVRKGVITGNTTMLYLLVGRSPERLSRAPFEADDLFGRTEALLHIPTYLPPCLSAFVGADITTAVEASGMTKIGGVSLLCDVGTNGEVALCKDGVLYVTSTAAGPAFEGAGISCGCAAIPGAIDSVRYENGRLIFSTIDAAPPVGICGSGIIDAAAALLDGEMMDETGALDEDVILAPGVAITQKDVRQVQLAKAAIAAGIAALVKEAGCGLGDVDRFFIAGGFGKHLNAKSAVRIGLFPKELQDKIIVIGNAAFRGAARALTDPNAYERIDSIRRMAIPVSLGGNKLFNELYVANMFF